MRTSVLVLGKAKVDDFPPLSPAVALSTGHSFGPGDGSNNISITLKSNQAEEMLIRPCTHCWEIGHVLQQVLFKSLHSQVYGNRQIFTAARCEALNTEDFQVVTVQGKRRC